MYSCLGRSVEEQGLFNAVTKPRIDSKGQLNRPLFDAHTNPHVWLRTRQLPQAQLTIQDQYSLWTPVPILSHANNSVFGRVVRLLEPTSTSAVALGPSRTNRRANKCLFIFSN